MGRPRRLTIPGRYNKIRRACAFVVAGAKKAGLDQKAIDDVELACDEACSNVIEHAYEGEGRGPIEVSWQVQDQSFVITVRDRGRPFNPDGVATPHIDPDDLKIGGLGLHFMRQVMDQVSFSFNENHGNTLVMVKRIA
ncbi:MAG: ATP-binding protein [Chloroflexota bacterium]